MSVSPPQAQLADPPSLHVPDEPVILRRAWYEAVLSGQDLAEVLAGPDGLVDWLWRRWQVLACRGLASHDLARVVLGYRREVWLWLASDRSWAQCCGGLLGRLARRVAV